MLHFMSPRLLNLHVLRVLLVAMLPLKPPPNFECLIFSSFPSNIVIILTSNGSIGITSAFDIYGKFAFSFERKWYVDQPLE